MFHRYFPAKASLVLSLLILLAVGYIFEEQADASSDNCTLRSAKGEFGGIFTGAITAAGPFAATARMVCDGKGSCLGQTTQNFNGLFVQTVDLSATYTINPECAGSIAVDFGPQQPPANFNFILIDGGKEIRAVQTDLGAVTTGILRQR